MGCILLPFHLALLLPFSPPILLPHLPLPPQRPRTQYPTVLDMVDIADPDIINILIDECRIDTILLIERRSDAERVIEVERPPGAEVVSEGPACVKPVEGGEEWPRPL